jgi:hypothetical protein
MGTPGSGDITVNEVIDRTDLHTFTLTAERDININRSIKTSGIGTAGLTMTAGRNIAINQGISVTGPSANLSVTANAAGDITGYGTMNLNGGALDMTAGGSIGGAGTEGLGQIFAGSLKMKATTGEVIMNSGVDWRASSFDLYAGTNIRGSAGRLCSPRHHGLCRRQLHRIGGQHGQRQDTRERYGGAIGTLNLTAQGTGGGGQIDFTSNAADQQRLDHGRP